MVSRAMGHISIKTIPEDGLTLEQKTAVKALKQHCFSDVYQEDIDGCFIAQGFARVLAYEETGLVGHLMLIKRHVEFDGKDVILGGFDGVCVSESLRRRKIGTRLMKKGLQILEDEGCDVACLNADFKKTADKFYEKIGFRLMNRQISFEDVHGKTRYDTGTMFIPVCSKEVCNQLMNSEKIFHYGKGYW
ncbi:MAG: GNAT family N-acetyltransferase [Candidatus Bathyarchaeia archaeon]